MFIFLTGLPVFPDESCFIRQPARRAWHTSASDSRPDRLYFNVFNNCSK